MIPPLWLLAAFLTPQPAPAAPAEEWNAFKERHVVIDTLRDSFSQGVPVRRALELLEKQIGRPVDYQPREKLEARLAMAEAVQSWKREDAEDGKVVTGTMSSACVAHAEALRNAANSLMVAEERREATVTFYLGLHGCLRDARGQEAQAAAAAQTGAYEERLRRRVTYSFPGIPKGVFGAGRATEDLPGGVKAGPGSRLGVDEVARRAASLPAAQVRRDLTAQPKSIPVPGSKDRLSPEAQDIVAVADRTILKMNARGDRFTGKGFLLGEIGNMSRMKLDCFHQAEVVAQALKAEGIGNTDDAGNLYSMRMRSYEARTEEEIAKSRFWSIRPPNLGLPFMNGENLGTNWYNNGHYWLEVRSKDPSQPIIHIDTWKGVYGIQAPGSKEIEWRPLQSADQRPPKSGGVEG